jgi:hypothetical protein
MFRCSAKKDEAGTGFEFVAEAEAGLVAAADAPRSLLMICRRALLL